MRAIKMFCATIAVVVAFLLISSPSASATVYDVDSADYTKSATLQYTSIMDNFEVTAKSGEHIKYSVKADTPGSCTKLLFSKGHNIGISSQYLVAYSQTSCVQSYSNEYPVGSGDGTDFTVTIATDDTFNINYTVTIKVFAPVIPDWLVGALVFLVIIIVVAVIGAVIRGRRKKAAQPPMMPPVQPPPEPPLPPQ